jgi:hypothetical protein
LRDGVSWNRSGGGARIATIHRGVAVWADEPVLDQVEATLFESATIDRSEECVQVALKQLAANGLLHDPDAPAMRTRCSGFNLIGWVFDEIDRAERELLHSLPVLDDVCAGLATLAALQGWLLESYHYTRGAAFHIPPVLDHTAGKPIHEEWRTFFEEEVTHWRIYRRCFTEFGWRWPLAECEPLPATRRFLNALRRAAEHSRAAYASVMMFIEQAPMAPDLSSDPLFGSLVRHYNLPRRAIQPLWEHAVLNRTLGHEVLGQRTLAAELMLNAAQIDDILDCLNEVIRANVAMLAEIEVFYSTTEGDAHLAGLRRPSPATYDHGPI